MNVHSHFSRDQSAENQSQKSSGFQIPRPPRTPERTDLSKSRAKSPTSSRKNESPRQPHGTTQQHAYPKTAGRQSSEKPVQMAQNCLGRDLAEQRQRGLEGWPTPAKTPLTSHIQNYHQFMENGGQNIYESPMLTVKQPGHTEVLWPRSSQKQLYSMNQRQSTQPAGKDTDGFKEPPLVRSVTSKQAEKVNQHGTNDPGVSQDMISTSIGASMVVHNQQTPKDHEDPGEEECDENGHFYASSVPYNYYHQYNQPAFYGANPHYYGPPQGSHAYSQYEQARRDYPVPMMSPHSRHAMYGQRQAYPHHYYEQVAAAYPQHYAHAAYYPPPPGASMNTYYDPNSKYQAVGRPYVDPRGSYPTYLNEEYMYGMHGYGPNPYEGSPSHMAHLMPGQMRSPHMSQCPQQTLSVHKSSKSRQQCRSGDKQSASEGRQQNCNGDVTGSARHHSQMHPRQLNFNDDQVENNHQQIHFEDVDASPNTNLNGNQPESTVQDNDDDRFEVVKIKLNNPQNDQKSQFSASQRISVSNQGPICHTNKAKMEPAFTNDLQSNMDHIEREPAMTQKADHRFVPQLASRRDMRGKQEDSSARQVISIKASKSQINAQHANNVADTPDRKTRLNQSFMTSGSVVRQKETDTKMTVICDPAKLMTGTNSTHNLPQGRECDETLTVMEASSVCNTLQSGQSKRRSYMFNEASGKMERVIRKRKRKTATQLEELANEFDSEPHWSKEKLLLIANKTNLTEAQVYKWGWDQKRKKYGVAEAERMRQYENILDQQNAKKAQNAQAMIGQIQNTGMQMRVEQVVTTRVMQKRQPELTPENRSNGAHDTHQNSMEQLINVNTLKEKEANVQSSIDNPKQAKHTHFHASAEQDFYNHPAKSVAPVSAFCEMPPARIQKTVEKPSNGLKNDNLQKSATTNTNTVQVSFGPYTPKNKLPRGQEHSDVQDYSDKFTPDNVLAYKREVTTTSQRRNLKLQAKDSAKIRKHLPESNGREYNQLEGQEYPQAGNSIPARQTRQRTSIQNEQQDHTPSNDTKNRRPKRVLRSKTGTPKLAE